MNGIICVYKPQGFTSFDVVAKCRGILQERRIGHGGTLDPMATGVLPLFLGRATPAADATYCQEKSYVAGLLPGVTTDTYDITGSVTSRADATGVTLQAIRSLLPEFTGEIEQTPPIYSAVQVNGQRLYKAARSGVSVEIPKRRVTVSELCAFEKNGGFFLTIRCSKGTYVRSIIHDLGQRLGCGAAMSSLERTMSCGFSLEDCVTMEQLQQGRNEGQPERWLLPVSRAFEGMPRQEIAPDRLRPFLNGLPTRPLGSDLPGTYAAWYGGLFLGLGEIHPDDRQLYPRKFFVEIEALRDDPPKHT